MNNKNRAEYYKQYRLKNKDKLNSYHKKWRDDNADKLKATNRRYYLRHRQKEIERARIRREKDPEYFIQYRKENSTRISESGKQWKKDNPDKARAIQKRYRKKYPEKMNEKSKKWARENPDKIRIRHKKYRQENPDKIKAINHKYRARKKNAEGSFTREEWEAKKKEFNYKCVDCGKSETELLDKTGIGLTIDHIIPLSKNGTNYISNIEPRCLVCNSSKNNKVL